MKGLLLILVATLSGCANRPAPIITIWTFCEVPVEMTQVQPLLAKPEGDYSQKDVAIYITNLRKHDDIHRALLSSIRLWSDSCRERAEQHKGEQ